MPKRGSHHLAPSTDAAGDEAEVWLDIRAAADFVGYSVQRLHGLRRSGEIPAERVGWRGWRFRQADLMVFVERRAGVRPSTPAVEDELSAMAEMLGATETVLVSDKPAHIVTPPLIRLVNALLLHAIRSGASDLHIEPDASGVRARMRIDGRLHLLLTIPKHIQKTLINRLKLMAEPVTHEQSIAQLGTMRLNLPDRRCHIRLSSLPSAYGETLVLHILRPWAIPAVEELGPSPEAVAVLDRLLEAPSGLLLLAGPSGSGLTTTAAALLTRKKDVRRGIASFEETPEYPLPGITQTYRGGDRLALAEAVPALLRRNPAILFLGDIHDRESARIAVDAALSGTLVIATIAGNDSLDAVRRLLAFGIDRRLVERALVGVCAQRLVRRLCPTCKISEARPAGDFAGLGHRVRPADAPIEIFRGRHCEECLHTGYQGRIGVFDVLPVDAQLGRLFAAGTSEAELRLAARLAGRIGFGTEAMRLLREGETSLDEVQHALHRAL